jgi:hypothetical protein
MTGRVVTTHYRYKRPLRKRKPVALAVPAIVTLRRAKAASIPDRLLPDTSEEHQALGDAADALWRELVRRVAPGDQS